MIWIILLVLGVLVSLALVAAPIVIGATYSQRRIAWNKALLARAVRTTGTVVEVPTYLTGGAQAYSQSVRSVPIVAYVAPDGTRRQARVKVSSPSLYTYGQPIDLLVDPANPDQVVLAAHSNDFGQANGVLVMCVLLSAMIAGILFMLWLVVGIAGVFAALATSG